MPARPNSPQRGCLPHYTNKIFLLLTTHLSSSHPHENPIKPSRSHILIEIIFLFCHYGITFREFLSFVPDFGSLVSCFQCSIGFCSFLISHRVIEIRDLQRKSNFLWFYVSCIVKMWSRFCFAECVAIYCQVAEYFLLIFFVVICRGCFLWMNPPTHVKKCNRVKIGLYCLKSKTDAYEFLSSSRTYLWGLNKKHRR